MQQGIINGTPLTDADERDVWNKLHDDQEYNVRSVAYLTVCNAHQLGIARPSPTTSLADTQALLARYNGTGARSLGTAAN
ncbi:hypothetical protein [Streptomyces sp. NPDC050164]|uniref:hypothetical protein n=1 Tax=Streptomyces sp. NPDC050164 TaxID=3365605 RepID=UPI00379F0031